MNSMTKGSHQNGFTSTGHVGVTDAAHIKEAGACVWWRLSGNINRDVLAAEWAKRGFNEDWLLAPAASSKALRRAVRTCTEERRLVRPLEGKKGWAIVKERAGGKDLNYRVDLVVTLSEPLFKGDTSPQHPVFDDEHHELAAGIRAEFKKHQAQLTPNDASNWLSRLVSERVDAVSLRDTGGIYFIPKHTLGDWRDMVECVRASSAHTILGMPAMPVAETIAAVMDAITVEATSEVANLEAMLEEGKLGKRGLQNRIETTHALDRKLVRYEGLLGAKLDALRDKLTDVRAAITVAILSAESEEAAA